MNIFKQLSDELDKQIEKEYKEMNLSKVEIQYRKVLMYSLQKEFEKIMIEGG